MELPDVEEIILRFRCVRQESLEAMGRLAGEAFQEFVRRQHGVPSSCAFGAWRPQKDIFPSEVRLNFYPSRNQVTCWGVSFTSPAPSASRKWAILLVPRMGITGNPWFIRNARAI